MNTPYIASGRCLSRRHFLKGTGAAFLALPVLDAMTPAFAQTPAANGRSPKRFVAMCATLGFHAPYFFPKEEGDNYTLTPYLQKIAEHRKDFSLISGLSHPQQQGNNGHSSEMTWLTSATRPGLAGFKNSVSLDQIIAAEIGVQTRYPYLALTTDHSSSLSWTENGVEIPAESSPSRLFHALFVNGNEAEVETEVRKIRRGQSILDTVMGEATKLGRELGRSDREKLDEYLTSVRQLESRLQESEGWVRRPKPAVEAEIPKDIENRDDSIARQRLMNDMIVLALQTDSTRTVTFRLSGHNSVLPNFPGVSTDWHNLSHHGKDEKKIEELKMIEEAEFEVFNEFLTKLKSIKENDRTLLDNTAVLYGSNLGNASSHDWRNLPILLAGGGYRHGHHVKHNEKDNTPLADLFVELAQRMGVEIERFGTSKGVGVRGLESA